MAFDENLANRVREIISPTHKKIEEKKMFGGLCFMINDKMCIGVEKERLMLRIDPGKNDDLLEKEGCTPMDFTGKVMRGFVFVSKDVLRTKKQLEYWVNLALEYNKTAPLSKKKKTKPSSK
ncbi:MAG TPA: TfoX/Sxy family protein [Chitinophagaceae bacterium]|jgi:TfoX/Sxy family transcriptional regulator of competence genes